MEIKPILVDSKTILIVDKTGIAFPIKANTIHTFKLTITSSRLPNTVELDILEYLVNFRVENELYKLTTDVLGLGTDDVIPDGVYTFNFNINNVIAEEETIAVITSIESKMADLSDSFSLDDALEDVIITKEMNEDATKFNYLVALYNKLLMDISINPDEVGVNDSIDKFNRLLVIWI
ncbi:hypothetical protein KAU11_10460 [Candidatus Babeliales bacterium]|nr:hypothetical protein [Candidatus Babeliales bacterium]